MTRRGSLLELVKSQFQDRSKSKSDGGKFARFFYRWGHTVASYPKLFALFACIITILCIPGMLALKQETDLFELFFNSNQQIYEDYTYIENNFERESRDGRFFLMMHDETSNAITPDIFKHWIRTMEMLIYNTTAEYDGKTITYEYLCIKYTNGQCQSVYGVNRIYVEEAFVPDNSEDILEVLNQRPVPTRNGEPLDPIFALYGQMYENGELVSAHGWYGNWFYDRNIDQESPEIEAWETEVISRWRDLDDPEGYDILLQCDTLWREELDEATSLMALGLLLACVGVVAYSFWVLGARASVHGRKTMLLACVLCIIFSLICAIGMTVYLGEKWNNMLPPTVILILGLALDDTFILTMDYQQQYVWMRYLQDEDTTGKSPEELFPIAERIGNIMSVGGFSIFITSFTDFIVFFICYSMTGLGVLKAFCSMCMWGCFSILFSKRPFFFPF